MSLEDVPSYLSTLTGMNETTAQLILSMTVICLYLFPYLILAHKDPSPFISSVMVFLGLATALGLGWGPFWVMIMVLFIAGGCVAILGAKAVTGGG